MRDLELVRHLARATAGTADVERVLEVALEVVCDHLGAGAGIVWQADPAEGWRVGHEYHGADGASRTSQSAACMPPVVRSMLATQTPSSLWRDTEDRIVAATLVGAPAEPRAVLQVRLDRHDRQTSLLEVCETITELLTRVVERASSEADLLEAQHLARLGSWSWEPVRDVVVASEQLRAGLGVPTGSSPSPSAETTLEGLVAQAHPQDRAALTAQITGVVDDAQPFEATHRTCPGADGGAGWVHWRGRAVTAVDGRVRRVVGTAQDVTERTELVRELEYRRTHDVVTGLVNRATFLARLDDVLAGESDRSVTVCVVAVDGLGRGGVAPRDGPAGDLLRRGVAERLRDGFGPAAILGRLVGDEFAVAVTDRHGSDGAPDLGITVLQLFDEPFDLPDGSERLAVSVGVAPAVRGPGSAEDLLHDAALAVELAHVRGADRMQVFDPEQHARSLQRLALEADLRQAVQQGDLAVAYQPLVDAVTGSMVATEALVRWERPGHGPVPASVFVPMAERLGLVDRLGSQVLLTACEQTVAWQQDFPHAAQLAVAVNLSARQLDDTKVVETVREALQRSGLAAEHLTIEITESALPHDAAGALARLWALRRLGVTIAIDDFGTGYSSLSRLRELPVDVLKIDRSFIADTGRPAPILTALFAMARTLDLTTVVEGVETPAQLATVLAHDCDRVQGYLFSRPLSGDGITRLLHDPGWDTDLSGDALVEARPPADAADVRLATLLERSVGAIDRSDDGRAVAELLREVAAAIGMDSVYLTRVDLPDASQRIEVVANVGALDIPEGESFDWSESLCRRALMDDRRVIADASADYPDARAAEGLDIVTCVVTPVMSPWGGLQGTLCAASADRREVAPESLELLGRVASIAADHLLVTTEP